jgi:predicted dehydrogenase
VTGLTGRSLPVVRLGLIGAGSMGRLHAAVIRDLPDAELVAVAEPDLGAQELVQDLVPSANGYADHASMLAAESLDAVIVATPEPLHRAPVEAAAHIGLHVLVEKPMALDPLDCDAMLDACQTAGVVFMVGYILRFEPTYAALHAAVDAGRFGRPVAMYARRCATIQEARRLGGRVSALEYVGVHDIDQVLWNHGAPVRRVRARGARGRVWEELGTPDTIWTTIEFTDGTVAVIEAGWALPHAWGGWPAPPGWAPFGDVRFDLTGTAGFASIDLRQMNLVGIDDDGWMFPDTRHWPQVAGGIGGALRAEVEDFVRCVRTRQPPLVDGEQGREVTRLLALAMRSLAEDRDVAYGEAAA